MEYIGLQEQLRKNNFKSILLLIAFPGVLVALLWLGLYILGSYSGELEIDLINKKLVNLHTNLKKFLSPYINSK